MIGATLNINTPAMVGSRATELGRLLPSHYGKQIFRNSVHHKI